MQPDGATRPPRRLRLRRAATPAVALLIGVGIAAAGLRAAPNVTIAKREMIVLSVSPISSGDPLVSTPPAPLRLEVDPQKGARGNLEIGWPDRTSTVRLDLAATEIASSGGQDHAVALEVELTLADGSRTRSARNHAFSDRSTFLFEVYRENDRPLTLVVEADTTIETTVTTALEVGAPMLLLLEIQRVDGDSIVPLETNRLNTFVGQPVSYSFRMGDRPESESVEVRFIPQRVVGSIAEIRVELSGKLPSPRGDVHLMSRTEQWIASRGAQSALLFASGDPPRGYRFLVTAEF